VWGVLGPAVFIITILYFLYPEKFERFAIHLIWLVSRFSALYEKIALSREVSYIVSASFAKSLNLKEVPKIVIEWGEEDRVLSDLRRNQIIIVLKRGKRYRYENVARAIVKALPELFAHELRVMYDTALIDVLSAHMARSALMNYPDIVRAINEYLDEVLKERGDLRDILSMIISIDDQSLFTRVLIPEMTEVAQLRYPHRDPQLDTEIKELIKLLHDIVKGVDRTPMLCGNYFRVLIVRVARPEKVREMLEPHIKFAEHSLRDCPILRTIYILAAGKNIVAAKALKILLENELRDKGLSPKIEEQEYIGRYRGKPTMKLYTCRITLPQQ